MSLLIKKDSLIMVRAREVLLVGTYIYIVGQYYTILHTQYYDSASATYFYTWNVATNHAVPSRENKILYLKPIGHFFYPSQSEVRCTALEQIS